jgi:hypothetical protein
MTTRTPHDPPRPAGGIVGDLKRVRRDGGATVAELREFVSQMRGRSPQEMLGMVSASELVRGVIIATIGTAVLIFAGTIFPYLRADKKPAKKPNDKTAPPTAATDNKATPTTDATAAMNAKKTDTDLDAAAKALKIDEVKSADPNSNPLDKDLDKLLDGKE